MAGLSAHLRELWRRVSRLDLFAIAVLLIGLVAALAEPARRTGGTLSFLKFLAILAAIYLIFRLIGYWRARLLWSLRNRLIVAYLFIAVVLVLLLLTLAILAGQLLYSQLGAYLFYEDLQRRVSALDDSARHIASVYSTLPKSIGESASEDILKAQAGQVRGQELPGLVLDLHGERDLLRRLAPVPGAYFSGVVQSGAQLSLLSIHEAHGPRGDAVIRLEVPVTPDLLEKVAPALGSVHLSLMDRCIGCEPREVLYTDSNGRYRLLARISARARALRPATSWFDATIQGYSKLEVEYIGPDGRVKPGHPAFVVFSARISDLNHRLFSSLGDFSNLYVELFALVAVVFLLIELAALIIGIVLTRRITKAVAELYRATQYVQAGDLTHRVRIERHDQLGVLGESFNLMTSSVSNLIEEQKRRQRLENEITIAREVQTQLFPRDLPAVAGVELEATCRAARVVSGDYYDFIPLGPTQLALAIADISGKGISAALLMASLQAALRSQVLAPGAAEQSTAELVSRLNLHLVRNTGDDRFATFFYAVYDSATRRLRYTNAGHLPSFLVSDGKSRRLTTGGMVLGVVEDYRYEQGTIEVAPGSLLVGYSDGLVEPENVYGEEFGIQRLEEVTLRLRSASPVAVAETLMAAVDEWAGTPEQFDDMTVIVARLF